MRQGRVTGSVPKAWLLSTVKNAAPMKLGGELFLDQDLHEVLKFNVYVCKGRRGHVRSV